MRRKFLRFALSASLLSMAVPLCGFNSKAEDTEIEAVEEVPEAAEVVDEEETTTSNVEVAPNSWTQDAEGNYYYLDENCERVTGLQVIDGATYCFGDDGRMVTGWFEIMEEWGPHLFYFLENGKGANGPLEVDGKNYFFMDGTRMETDLVLYEGTIYVIDTENDGTILETVKAKNGWNKVNGKWCYVQNGDLVSGWKKIDGVWYHFVGYMSTNSFVYDSDSEAYYYVDETGKMRTGWVKIDYGWFYFKPNGLCAKGLTTVDGIQYYFDQMGCMRHDNVFVEAGIVYNIDAKGKVLGTAKYKNGWLKVGPDWVYCEYGDVAAGKLIKSGGAWYFLRYDGRLSSSEEVCYYVAETDEYVVASVDSEGRVITGWIKTLDGQWRYLKPETATYANGEAVVINGSTYVFDIDGIMVEDRVCVINGKVYNVAKSGKVLASATAKEGWIKLGTEYAYMLGGNLVGYDLINVDGYWYYMQGNCLMAHDQETVYWYDESSDEVKEFAVDSKGHIVTGWVKMYGGWRYLDSMTLEYEKDIFLVLNDKVYQMDYDGFLMVNNTFYCDDKLYHTYADGTTVIYSDTKTGWVNNTYYIENNKVVTGWKTIEGKTYYFDETGRKVTGIYEVSGKGYYFDSTGAMKKNAWIKTNGSYVHADSNGELASGDCEIGTKRYYFDNYLMVTGVVGGMLFDNNGACQGQISNYEDPYNFYTVGGKTYYVIPGGVYHSGVFAIDGKDYLFDDYGVMQKNVECEDFYMGSDGAAVKNKWVEFGPGVWAYYGSSGLRIYTGWKKIGSSYYYFEDGCAVIGDKVIDNKLYHFTNSAAWDGKDGKTVNGWYKVNGRWHYSVAGADVNGWKKIDGAWYYFEEGLMAYDSVVIDDNQMYIVDKNGKMVTNGWYALYANQGYTEWFYLDKNGNPLQGLQTIGGKKYFFYGSMCKDNMVSEDGKTLYEINANGVVTKVIKATNDGWFKSADGSWYYVLNGKFVITPTTIGGKLYYFNYDGRLLMNGITYDFGYVDKDGIVGKKDGWVKVGDVWQYLIDNKPADGAYTVNGKYYYGVDFASCAYGIFEVDGVIYDYMGDTGIRTAVKVKEGWNEFNGMSYYVENGSLVHGWKKINNKWYHFDDIFSYMDIDTIIYSYDNNGVKEGIHALDASGKMVVNNWYKSYNGWMYLGNDGCPVTGTQVIGGKQYQFDTEGYLY